MDTYDRAIDLINRNKVAKALALLRIEDSDYLQFSINQYNLNIIKKEELKKALRLVVILKVITNIEDIIE